MTNFELIKTIQEKKKNIACETHFQQFNAILGAPQSADWEGGAERLGR